MSFIYKHLKGSILSTTEIDIKNHEDGGYYQVPLKKYSYSLNRSELVNPTVVVLTVFYSQWKYTSNIARLRKHSHPIELMVYSFLLTYNTHYKYFQNSGNKF